MCTSNLAKIFKITTTGNTSSISIERIINTPVTTGHSCKFSVNNDYAIALNSLSQNKYRYEVYNNNHILITNITVPK